MKIFNQEIEGNYSVKFIHNFIMDTSYCAWQQSVQRWCTLWLWMPQHFSLLAWHISRWLQYDCLGSSNAFLWAWSTVQGQDFTSEPLPLSSTGRQNVCKACIKYMIRSLSNAPLPPIILWAWSAVQGQDLKNSQTHTFKYRRVNVNLCVRLASSTWSGQMQLLLTFCEYNP